MNIGSLWELRAILRAFVIIKRFLGVWLLFNGIKYLFY